MLVTKFSNKKGHEARRSIANKKPEFSSTAYPYTGTLIDFQNQIGNQAVQRLLAQRRGDGAFELDDTTANRINSARSGGQALDRQVQDEMGSALGHDFSHVRVHISGEADALNQQLSAKAFATGSDLFFREGAYNPGSSSGKELLAHELTHVVQQSSGAVSGGGKMTVNAPGDRFEQEADAVANAVSRSMASPQVQAQASGEAIHKKEDEEDNSRQQAPLEEENEEEVAMPPTAKQA